MMRLKDFHLWLNQHSEIVRFWIAMVVAAIVIVTLYNQNQAFSKQLKAVEEASRQRDMATQRVLRALDDKTDDIKKNANRNTNLIACLLAIHGETRFVTPQDQERCQTLIDDSSVNGTAQPAPQSPTPKKKTTPKPSGGNDEPENPPGIIGEVGQCISGLIRLEIGECTP